MEALRGKWNSCRGASILLALLFLLVCMMAAASILMAAASNAGKLDSNKKEQQKYLAVSSAMTMLADELQKVEYAGQYEWSKTAVYIYRDREGNEFKEGALSDEEKNATNDDGTPKYEKVIDHYKRTYEQQPGALTGSSWLGGVLPMRNDLDYLFARLAPDSADKFEVPANRRDPWDEYTYYPLNTGTGINDLTVPENSYTLTFTAPAGYGGLNQTVYIKAELRKDGSIRLTGTTKDKDGKTDFTMMALLRPCREGSEADVWPEDVLVLPNDPSLTNADGSYYRTESIHWKLKYIFKQEMKPDA